MTAKQPVDPRITAELAQAAHIPRMAFVCPCCHQELMPDDLETGKYNCPKHGRVDDPRNVEEVGNGWRCVGVGGRITEDWRNRKHVVFEQPAERRR